MADQGSKRFGSPLEHEESKRLASDNLNVSLEGVSLGVCGDGAGGVTRGSSRPPSEDDERLRRQLLAALRDREVIETLCNFITNPLKKEIAHLWAELTTCKDEMRQKDELLVKLEERMELKDHQMEELEQKIDDMEMYSRRNLFRINGIVEKENESTDELVVGVAKIIGVDLKIDEIDRSHRVGRREGERGEKFDRPIIVKFTSYRSKRKLMKDRKNLKDADFSPLFSPTAAESGGAGGEREDGEIADQPKIRLKVFINDDLTKARARLAAKARTLKKDKVIADTWVSDGVIIVKKLNGDTKRVTTLRELVDLTN